MRITSLWQLFAGTRAELGNWATTAPLGCLVAPSRFLPSWNPLARSALARRPLHLRLRNGMRITCRAHEFPPFLEAFVTRTYDIPGIDWRAVRTIVDVGANVGMATLWLASQSPSVRIVAVEPSADASERLRRNVRDNGLSARVTTVEAAVGARSGQGVLQAGAQSPTARVSDGGVGETVRVVTLEQVLDEHGIATLDVLKLDCEGAEYAILESAGSVLRRVRTIVGEYHPVPGRQPAELHQALTAAGFEVEMVDDRIGLGTFMATRGDLDAAELSTARRA